MDPRTGHVKGAAVGGQPSREEIVSVSADELPADFVAAMNDDINVSGASVQLGYPCCQSVKYRYGKIHTHILTSVIFKLLPECCVIIPCNKRIVITVTITS